MNELDLSDQDFNLMPKDETVASWCNVLSDLAHATRQQVITLSFRRVILFLDQVHQNTVHLITRKTSNTIIVDETLQQMFWVHQIRSEMREVSGPFLLNKPGTQRLWLQGKRNLIATAYESDDAYTAINCARAAEFLEIWRMVANTKQTGLIRP